MPPHIRSVGQRSFARHSVTVIIDTPASAPTANRLKRFLLVLPAVAGICVAGGCGGDGEPQPTPTAVESREGSVSVVLKNSAFEPERLRFSAGETVEFNLNSVDEVHTFTVEELGINWVVTKENEPQSYNFVFERPGTYNLVCVIPGHKADGMVGQIVVE